MEPSRHRFAAVLTPHGLDVIEHLPRGRKLAVERHARSGEAFAGLAQAATRLADLMESLGGRKHRLDLVLSGFDVRYHVLELPTAERKLLAPVVERELRQLEPNLARPVIGFSYEAPLWDRPKTLPGAVLAAAVPQNTLEVLSSALENRGIRLHYVTVVPQAVQRLYEVFAEQEDPAILVLVMPEFTVIATFVEGRVRLCWESNVRSTPGGPIDEDVLAGRLAAARHFIQQTSRGSTPSKVLLAAESEERASLEKLVRHAAAASCEPLGPAHAAPGALLALGASLDAVAKDRLNLLPSHLRSSPLAEPVTRAVAAGIGALAVAIAGSGAWASLSQAAGSGADWDLSEVAAIEARLEAVEPILRARKEHGARLAVFKDLARRRAWPPALLHAIAQATPEAVQLDSIVIQRLEAGWQARVSGTGAGFHAASAMGSVDRMFRELSLLLSGAKVTLAHLSDATGDREAEARVQFTIAITLEDETVELSDTSLSARGSER
jgi:Tfp pilus assembly protein PilN